MSWINELMDNYYSFLKEKTVLSPENSSGWIQISTPFIGIFNDALEIYAKQEKGKIILTDDGQTLKNLELSGVPISRSPKRKELMEQVLLNYGVRLEDHELIIEANENNFPQKKLNLISAISEANDLYFLAKHTVASVFREDVRLYLDEQDIIYTQHFISRGSIGLEFTFDFQIAYRHSEIVIKAFNSINKMNLPHFLYTWSDIRKAREKQSGKKVLGLAVVNDVEYEVKGEYLDALDKEGAEYILWSRRHEPTNILKLKSVANG